jgi:hypothetical protein
MFGFGTNSTIDLSVVNLVSNTGVVASEVSSAGTNRSALAAAGYGFDKAIFAYGTQVSSLSMSNLVSNTGVVGSDEANVGTARGYLAAATYGVDKAIFGFGVDVDTSTLLAVTNLVSNTGVVSDDQTTITGTARFGLAGASYGG